MIQEQYIFLHRAVLEGLTCTDTRIEASQLEAVLAELSVHDPQLGCSGLEEEFTMLEAMTPHPKHDTRRTALQYPRNNGSMDSLRTCTFHVYKHAYTYIHMLATPPHTQYVHIYIYNQYLYT